MNRALLLLPMAALASGCYVAPPCDPVANVYWAFTVPGLNGVMSCAEAGVDSVDVFVDNALVETVPCQGPSADGIQLVGFGHGTRLLSLDVYAGNTRRYQYDGNIAFNGCTSSFDAVASGIAGRLQFQYAFGDGGNLCAGPSYLWFQVTSGGAVYDAVDDASTNPLALACTNTAPSRNVDVLNASGGTSIPAGVYTRTRFEEVVPAGATYTPQRANCAQETFVHAGDDARPVTLVASSTLCP
ncbi:MAG: hypothetical protein HZB56_09645 [Deltaproteobacteria bacterium]|nr:hypothetical protein [Deltaproteobacteria bacterium]